MMAVKWYDEFELSTRAKNVLEYVRVHEGIESLSQLRDLAKDGDWFLSRQSGCGKLTLKELNEVLQLSTHSPVEAFSQNNEPFLIRENLRLKAELAAAKDTIRSVLNALDAASSKKET